MRDKLNAALRHVNVWRTVVLQFEIAGRIPRQRIQWLTLTIRHVPSRFFRK